MVLLLFLHKSLGDVHLEVSDLTRFPRFRIDLDMYIVFCLGLY